MGILIVIILVDIIAMVIVMRLVLGEPPHKAPAPHPFAQAERAQQAGEAERDHDPV